MLPAHGARCRGLKVRGHSPFLDDEAMTKYLLSFPASAMNVPSEDMAAVGEAAIQWAAKLAQACRCPQELREFMFDPES